jgi:C_GCAxxG_C_C family probable redox protein
MKTRTNIAAASFINGFNCAQAVFSTYAPLLKIKEKDALRIATGFGGGMGRLQEACGAVTGAFMVIGCKYGMMDPVDTTVKEKAYSLVQEFSRRFQKLHGSISCRELLGCDLNTAEGKQQLKEKDLSNQVCLPCVRDAAKIIEEILFSVGD